MHRIVPTTKPMVLVIDEDDAYLEAATGVLRTMGYRVIAVRNRQTAVEVLRSLTPDIMLTDLRSRMPLAVALVGEGDADACAMPRFDAPMLRALVARIQAAAAPHRSGMHLRVVPPVVEARKG